MAGDGGLASRAYHAVMRDGTVAAIGREAIKDVRSTIMEVFFGKGERGAEPGTPLNPLFYDIVAARNSHPVEGQGMDASLPSPSQVIDNPGAYLPQGQGQQQGNMQAMGAAPGRADGGGNDATGTLPTPSQVAADPQAYLDGQEQHNGRGHGREM